jgi:hypothetical protein
VADDTFTVAVEIATIAEVTGPIADASDRVGATGGSFLIDNDAAHSTRLRGVWPCAS